MRCKFKLINTLDNYVELEGDAYSKREALRCVEQWIRDRDLKIVDCNDGFNYSNTVDFKCAHITGLACIEYLYFTIFLYEYAIGFK